METLRIRCPGCQKKYGVEPSQIKDAKPEFLCRQCGVKFYFDYPPTAPGEILGKVKAAEPSGVVNSVETESFACPKCKYQNRKGSKTCQSCGIVFEKYEKRQKGVQPDMLSSDEMRTMWESVLTDYSNMDKHDKFVRECLARNQLPYASQQYRIMIETNTADTIAIKMRDKIIEMATLTFMPPKRDIAPVKQQNFPMIIGIVGLVLGLAGLMIDTLKMLSGLGFVMMAAGAGLHFYKKSKAQN